MGLSGRIFTGIQVTWIAPPRGLKPKMDFYVEHFMELKSGHILGPITCSIIGCKGSRSPSTSFKEVLINFGWKLDTKFYKRIDYVTFPYQELETKEHFVFKCQMPPIL
jgi:hypothetical protein